MYHSTYHTSLYNITILIWRNYQASHSMTNGPGQDGWGNYKPLLIVRGIYIPRCTTHLHIISSTSRHLYEGVGRYMEHGMRSWRRNINAYGSDTYPYTGLYKSADPYVIQGSDFTGLGSYGCGFMRSLLYMGKGMGIYNSVRVRGYTGMGIYNIR